MSQSDHPNPVPEIPMNDPPAEREDTPREIDLPAPMIPSDQPPQAIG